VRQDRGGAIDVAGISSPDGIVGTFREKEKSFYRIKEIWSHVYFALSEQDQLHAHFQRMLALENGYVHTNLNQVNFSWQLINFPLPDAENSKHMVVAQGTVPSPDVRPHHKGTVAIKLLEDWRKQDTFYLTAIDSYGRKIYTWTWMTPALGDYVC
jgi:hypothetical protein